MYIEFEHLGIVHTFEIIEDVDEAGYPSTDLIDAVEGFQGILKAAFPEFEHYHLDIHSSLEKHSSNPTSETGIDISKDNKQQPGDNDGKK
jgi:hypothetical protein